MAHPCLVAGIVAVAIGSLFLPFEASARSGGVSAGAGIGAGRAGGAHIGSPRGAVRSFAPSRSFHRGPARPSAHGKTFHRDAGRRFGPRLPHDPKFGRHHRRDIGLGLPWAAAVYGDGAFGVPGYAGPVAPVDSVGPDAPAGGPLFYRHVCRSDVQTVPSGRGGEVDVTVTRCYVVAD
jgi:hypothetical protein